MAVAATALHGLSTHLATFSGGLFELAPQADHLVLVHVGAPVDAACACDDLRVRGLQVEGNFDVVPAGATATWEEDGPATVLQLRLTPALVRATARELGQAPDRVAIAPRLHVRDPQVEHIAWALRAAATDAHPGGRLYVESLGRALAAHLLGRAAAEVAGPGRSGLSKPQLRRVVDYVEAELEHDIGLDDLAAVAGLSASHFKVLFKRSTGLPPYRYVIRRRVERARDRLLDGAAISDAALDAGFAHPSHLARAMRQVLGVTPGALARSRR